MPSRQRVNRLFELWARWCVAGSILPASGASVLSKMIDNHGMMIFSSGGGKQPHLDCIESDIERALLTLFKTDPVTVKVVRYEYLGQFKHEDKGPVNQVRKAAALGMSISTYERRLSKGRKYVMGEIDK